MIVSDKRLSDKPVFRENGGRNRLQEFQERVGGSADSWYNALSEV